MFTFFISHKSPEYIKLILPFGEIPMELFNQILWTFLLFLLSGTGIYFTLRLKFLPLKKLPFAVHAAFAPSSEHTEGDITPFQSLMTSLAAMLGTGNISGVASALVLGGPGALFWMEVSAFVGLATKYSESFLSVLYRSKNKEGEMCGGPMYVMKAAMKPKWLGSILSIAFCIAGVASSFGIGNMTQANALSAAFQAEFHVPVWISGALLTLLVSIILVGGIKRIGSICGIFVPAMSIFYLVSALLVIVIHFSSIPSVLLLVFRSAFSLKSISGGIGGTMIARAIRIGMSRGIFSNEAGLGSGGIAAACAQTDNAVLQGYISMSGNFFDTIFICTITGLVILCSGCLGNTAVNGEAVTGTILTMQAFQSTLPFGSLVVSISQILFGFSTIVGWEYYGEKCLEFLIDSPYAITSYRIVYSLIAFIGAVAPLHTIWTFADIMNGFMAIPNLICLLLLQDIIVKHTL